ncbi:MAG: ATP-binding protein [Colwellia sp.]
MLKQAEKNTVFKRYNIAIVVAFIVIILVALSVSSVRYFSELATLKKQGLTELKGQAHQLNTMLAQSVQAIDGIQEFAQYALKFPNEVNAQMPPLAQEGDLFYLDNPHHDVLEQPQPMSGNITGFGQIEQFDIFTKQELVMANALTPAFITAQKVIEEATWFYYVSLNRFVNIYPWISRENWHFSDRMLTNLHNQKIQQLNYQQNQVVWSSPYIDAAGTGLNSSLGKGIFRSEKLLGAVVIDINLALLHKNLPKLTSPDQAMVLFNQQNQVLIFKQADRNPLLFNASWQKLLPNPLKQLTAQSLTLLENSVRIDDLLIEKQTLAVNGWTLLKYQHYENFTAPLQDRFVFIFMLLFIGLLAFLMLVNFMTKRSFIKPTTEFIQHIEYCAQGDPGKIKPNIDWLHWFELVEDIFAQNRSLLQQLKDQNEILDNRVNEKTKALQESSKKHQRDYVLLRSVMNALPEFIIFNDPQGLLMGCNREFERLTHLKESNMLGHEASQFMPKALANKIKDVNRSLHDNYPQQTLFDAGEYSYQSYCNQFINDAGEILGTIIILRDVTEQQKIQTVLEKAKNQAEYANQVKIQFLANMSHEIRTPINAMKGMIDLLATTLLDSRQQHYLLNAQTASSSLLHLIDELLDLSKIEAGKMIIAKEPVNLAAIVNKALNLNVVTVEEKKLTMQVAFDAQVPTCVESDEMRLIQVLANLLNNAIKFTQQGEVKLLIDTIALSETNALVRFNVVDSGIGIAPENQENLFEAFTQADESMTRKYGGSGLGLSICQQIVKLLGGEITLKSQLGRGCEFSFVLPFTIVEPTKKSCLTNAFLTDVTLCTVKQKLSVTFIDTVAALGWNLHQFNSVNDLNSQQFDAPVVLMLAESVIEEHLSLSESSNLLNEHWQQQITLIALCQSAMAELSDKTSAHLASLSTPYLLLDTPIYRYSLDQIKLFLLDPSKIDKPIIKEKMSALQVSALKDGSLKENALVNTPENKANSPVPSRDNKQSNDKNLQGVKVLLVEDNLVNQLVAKELLLNMKADVVIAENGQCALDLLKIQTFDVILMDIQMPIMDGLTAAKNIRTQNKYAQLPIIAMTAHARVEDKQQSLRAGMNLHIAKPVTAKLLLASIIKVLHKN